MTVNLDYHKALSGLMSAAAIAAFVWWLNAREAINTIPEMRAKIETLETDRQLVVRLEERLRSIDEKIADIKDALK